MSRPVSSMVSDPNDGGDPRVTVRIPEEYLGPVRSIADRDDNDYSMAHIIRYSMDRKFERIDVNWSVETKQDLELENLFEEHGIDYGNTSEAVNAETKSILEDIYSEGLDTVNPGLEDFDRAVTIYGLARDVGDQDMEELISNYLRSEFPETKFTENIVGSKE